MTTLIKAAGVRALRTLIQGLLAGTVVNIAIAAALGEADGRALIIAGSTVVVAAVTSFLQGILAGLPEAEPVMLGVEPSSPSGLAHVIATVGGNIVSEGHFDMPSGNPTSTRPCGDACVEYATD